MRGSFIGVVGLALVGCRAGDDDLAAATARIDALEDEVATLTTQMTALQEQLGGDIVTTADLADYATEQWVEDQGYLTAAEVEAAVADALPAGDLATEAWVDQHYTTPADVTAQIAGALPAGSIATETWVDDHYQTATEVDGQITARLPAGTLATQQWVTDNTTTVSAVNQAIATATAGLASEAFVGDAIAAALPAGSLATEAWVGDHYVGQDQIGAGLTLTLAGDVEVDTTAIEATVRTIAFDTVQELRNALDDAYVPDGPVDHDLLLDTAIRFSGTDADCDPTQGVDPDEVGLVQYVDGQFLGCTDDGWVVLGAGKDGSFASPGESCLQIRTDFPGTPDGIYWLRGPSGKYSVYCDQTTDGGGWTLLATISGGDGNSWNTQEGNWTNTSPVGSAEDPWHDHKSRAFFELDITGAEVLYQRRYDGVVRARAVLDTPCLHAKQSFRDLFVGNSYALRCPSSAIRVLHSSATGLAGSTYQEGTGSYGLGHVSTNGFCWNGGDIDTNTFRGRAFWMDISTETSCLTSSHLGGIALWQASTSQYTLSDITGTNWLNGTDYTKTDISFFVR